MRLGQTLPTLTRPFCEDVKEGDAGTDGNRYYLRAAGAAGQALLLRALGGDGCDAED
jgi:hypothetical protein